MTITQSFLGMCLQKNDILLDTKLRGDDFPQVEAVIFEKMKQLYIDGQDVSLITLKNSGVDIGIFARMDTQLTSAWRSRQKQIIEATQKREILALAEKITQSHTLPAPELAIMLKEGVGSLDGRDDYEAEYVYQVAERVRDEAWLRGKQKQSLLGIPTGIYDLDTVIYGFQKRKLYYVGGRPSQGKTSLLINFALNSNRTFAFFSAESAKDEVVTRMFAHHGKINSRSLHMGIGDEELPKMTSFIDKEKGIKSIIYDKSNMGIDEVALLARKFVESYGVEVIYIDYIQILGPSYSAKRKDKREQILDISMKLKQLARDLNVPVVVAAQLTRDSDKERPGLASFSESSQIEKDADVAVLIWHTTVDREVEENGRKKKIPEPRSFLLVEKNRDGETRSVEVYYKKDTQTFENVSRYDYR